MAVAIDITGNKYNSLTAVRFHHKAQKEQDKPHYWVFRCDCGNEIVARKNAVTSGNTKRCKECSYALAKLRTTHGFAGSRLYREWAGIIQRCENPKSTSWMRYGAVGVTVCDEWHSFAPFMRWALQNGYSENLQIDRIDINGNYEPSNCRWVSMREQANNKKTTVFVQYNGEQIPLSFLAQRIGMKYHTLHTRLFKLGWSVERATSTPVRIINRKGELKNGGQR